MLRNLAFEILFLEERMKPGWVGICCFYLLFPFLQVTRSMFAIESAWDVVFPFECYTCVEKADHGPSQACTEPIVLCGRYDHWLGRVIARAPQS